MTTMKAFLKDLPALRDLSISRAIAGAAGLTDLRSSPEGDWHDVLSAEISSIKLPLGHPRGTLFPLGALDAGTAAAGQELVFDRPVGIVPLLRAKAAPFRLGGQIIWG